MSRSPPPPKQVFKKHWKHKSVEYIDTNNEAEDIGGKGEEEVPGGPSIDDP